MIERVVRVAVRVERVKGVAIVSRKWKPLLEAARQIGIRDEMAAESHRVRGSAFQDGLGSVWLKSAGSDDLALEDRPHLLGGDCPLMLQNDHIALHAWFDDVEVSESDLV